MTLDAEVDALRRVPLFRGIDADQAEAARLHFRSHPLRAGEYLCHQGEEGDSAFILLDGSAEIRVETPDGEKTVAHLGRHSIVGEIAILCDVPRTASVIAAEELDVLTVSKDDFLRLLKEFPDMSLEVMRTLAQRLERTTQDLAALKASTGAAA